MPRRPLRETPGAALVASLGPPKPKRNHRTPSAAKKQLERAAEELAGVLKGEIEGEPRHLVALYAWAHEGTYGVFPEELRDPKEWSGACSSAKRMITECFGGVFAEAVEFMRWDWAKIADLIEFVKGRGGEVKTRVKWRQQIMYRDRLTDYRASQAERGRGGR